MTQITPTDQGAALRRSVPALAALRLGFAVLLATRPGESRLVGARELALGLGTLDAYRSGAPVSGWVGAMAVADGSDALSFLGEAATRARGAAQGAVARGVRGQRARGRGADGVRPAPGGGVAAGQTTAGTSLPASRMPRRTSTRLSRIPPTTKKTTSSTIAMR